MFIRWEWEFAENYKVLIWERSKLEQNNNKLFEKISWRLLFGNGYILDFLSSPTPFHAPNKSSLNNEVSVLEVIIKLLNSSSFKSSFRGQYKIVKK